MKSQWMVSKKFRSTFLIIFAASIFALFGCSVIGQTVPVENRIPLVSGSIQRGEQVVKGVKLTYTYRLHQRSPDLSRLLVIEVNAQHRFRSDVFMYVWIDFLDGEGKILERKDLTTLSYWASSFQADLEAPAGTAGISFGVNEGKVGNPFL